MKHNEELSEKKNQNIIFPGKLSFLSEKFRTLIVIIFQKAPFFLYVLLGLCLIPLAILIFIIFFDINVNYSFEAIIAQKTDLKSGYTNESVTICRLSKNLKVTVEDETEDKKKKKFYWVKIPLTKFKENSDCLTKNNNNKQAVWGYIAANDANTKSIIKETTYYIKTRDGDGVNVRKEPSSINQNGYVKGEKICAIGDGSKVDIIDIKRIDNNELWYKIKDAKKENGSTELKKAEKCPKDLKGWIIAELSDGRKTVTETKPPKKETDTENQPTGSWSELGIGKFSMFKDIQLKEAKDLIKDGKIKYLARVPKKIFYSHSFLRTIYMCTGIIVTVMIYWYAKQQQVEVSYKLLMFTILFLLTFITTILFDSYEEAYLSTGGNTAFGNLMYDLNRFFFDHPSFLANTAGGFVFSILLLKFISFADK